MFLYDLDPPWFRSFQIFEDCIRDLTTKHGWLCRSSTPSRSWCGWDTSNPSQLCHGTLWASQACGGMRIHRQESAHFFGCHWHPAWGKHSDFFCLISTCYIFLLIHFVFFSAISAGWWYLLPGSGRKPSPCCRMWLRCMALKVMLIGKMELEYETLFLESLERKLI